MDTVDLNIFDGMEGFEEFNPLDDSSLAAILDDLEEGTLLSLLEDKNLFIDMCTDDVQPDSNSDYISDLFADGGLAGTELLGHSSPVTSTPDVNLFDTKQDSVHTLPEAADFTSTALDGHVTLANSTSSDCSDQQRGLLSIKRPLQNTLQVESFKRVKLEDPHPLATSDESGNSHLLLCVEHDHCYVPWKPGHAELTKGQKLQDGDTSKVQRSHTGNSSDEEGSLSDTGYETMSSSTSPGSNSTLSTECIVAPPNPLKSTSTISLEAPAISPVVSAQVDPVALIDARIKHFMCSREVNLTEEEKETLKAEGLPIPTTLPLTKTEEKVLRGVRRKIRNKVAAQESRKRRKEHLVTLEERCNQYSDESCHLKRRVETLEIENQALLSEVKKLRELLSSQPPSSNASKTTRVGACLMVMVLCFAIFFGSMTPQNIWSPPNDYTTTSVRSRTLLSVGPSNFQSKACYWFKQIFMMESGYDDLVADHYREGPSLNFEPQHYYGPLSYYQHIYSQFSGLLNYSNTTCSAVGSSS